jgi:hypothetical protein
MSSFRSQALTCALLGIAALSAISAASVEISKEEASISNTGKSEQLWWSLRPLRKILPPPVKNAGWPRTPVDHFILAKLEEKNLQPSPEADQRTLLRRVTFDLAGLPPTPEEIQDFLGDNSPEAYTKVVDRLLSSPRYGERWARHWLDVVHYADTHGHDQDRPRTNSWPYRDYVIRSLNEDKPYARFAEEQVAGDALFPDDPQGVIATGFIATGPWDESSQMHIMADTVDKKIAQNLDRDDMVTTAMSTFVSSTVHCARCHDHKFDPIPQAEYYGLQAVFAGVDRTDRPFDWDSKTHLLRQSLLKRKTALEVRQKNLSQSSLEPFLEAEVASGQTAWETRMRSGASIWTVLDPVTAISASGATLVKQPDLSLLSSGTRPDVDTYTITAQSDLKGITALRLELLPDDSLPKKGPGRQDNGNLHLSEMRAKASPRSDPAAARSLVLQNPTADFNQEGWTIAMAIDGKTNTAWGIHPQVGKPHAAVLELKESIGFDGGTTLTFILDQLHGRAHVIGRFRLSVTTAPLPVQADSLPAAIGRIMAIPEGQRSEQHRIDLAAYYRTISPELKRIIDQIDQKLAALPLPQQVYAAAHDFKPQGKFTPARIPRPIHLLRRGEITRPGELVSPTALSCMTGLESRFQLGDPNDEGSRRAALAKWITDPKNALTWRSIVNRVWHYHFGRGIVDTPSDFGRMGSAPSHPELLDWLALRFLESGGSLKQLHKLILTSAAYRQSSRHNAEFAKVDAGNVYLWRMNRSRLDAESLRDSILQISGKLDWRMGGVPVKQFHFEDPDPGITPKVDYARFNVDSPESFRRSIYRWIFRTIPDPFMDSMDCPDSSQLTPARNSSVTPLQALAMMNNAFVVRQSEHFANRLAGMHADRSKQIDAAYVLAYGREATAEERTTLATYATKHGLANVCRLILNSNEFIFVN